MQSGGEAGKEQRKSDIGREANVLANRVLAQAIDQHQPRGDDGDGYCGYTNQFSTFQVDSLLYFAHKLTARLALVHQIAPQNTSL